MKKTLFLIALFAITLNLYGCSDISQAKDTLEVGTEFNPSEVFNYKDGYSVTLKPGSTLDTGTLGTVEATFIIDDGNSQQEKTFSFEIVDTQAPVIEAEDTKIFDGTQFVPENFASCTDNSGEEISISVTENTVDSNVPGIYSVTYEAIDSSGNKAEKTIAITVSKLTSNTQLVTYINDYLTQNNIEGISATGNDIGMGSVCIQGPRLASAKIDENRTLRIRPEIYMLEDVFSGHYKVSGIIFRMEVEDRGPLSSRYSLYADKLNISSQTDNMEIIDGLPSIGEFERSYYLSRFDYKISSADMTKFIELFENGPVSFDIATTDEHTDLSHPMEEVQTPVSFHYDFSENDTNAMEEMFGIYDYFLQMFGAYPS